MGQHVDGGFLQIDAGQVDGLELAGDGFHVAVHFGRFAKQDVHRHVHWSPHACHFVYCAAPRGGEFS